MILVKTCCGCISLQKGSIVIGILTLISAVLNTIFIGIHVHAMELPRERTAASPILIMFKMFVVSLLIYLVLGATFSIFMIYGAAKRISRYVFPWVAIHFGSTVAAFCVTWGCSIIAAMEFPVTEFVFVTLCSFTNTALQVYFWQVVYSHYKELVAEKYGHQTRPKTGKVLSTPPYYNV